MSDFISSIGSFLTSNSKPLNSVLGLAGTAGNLFGTVQQVQEQNRLNNAQSYVTSLLTNPSKLSAATAAYTQPLTAGLTNDIANQVQGNLAERGLGSSPAAYTQQLTQALAPYIQTQQQNGLQALMQSLGLASNLRPINSGTQDISKLLAQLKIGGNSNTDPYAVLFNANQPTNLSTTDPFSDIDFSIPAAA